MNGAAWVWVVLGLATAGIAAVVIIERAPAAAAGLIHELDWRTSPLDLNLRGANGERFRYRCPPGKLAAGAVTGSGPYTDNSSICAAAVHAGALRAGAGGVITIEIRPGESRYPASFSHYVQSLAYDSSWSGSFVVLPPEAPTPPH
ncbi:MAG: hypothetical protein JSR67_09315 [Proteobacteria bacterium]|nr:hypothetical protein [Pseudomonadota bacterium]